MVETFKATTAAPRGAWRDLMNKDPEAIPYQSPEWLDAICQGRRYSDASRLYEFADGCEIVLPLVERRYVPGVIATATSFPTCWGMGGVITPANLQRHHPKAVIAVLKGLPYLRLNVRPNPRRGDLWADVMASENIQQRSRLAHAIDLTGGFDQVFARFSKETRSRIRKAEKFGIEVKCSSNGDLVHVLYDLLEKSVARWAKKQNEPEALARWRFHQRDPIEKIQAIVKSLGEHCRVWVASIDGRPVASLLVLLGKNANDSRSAIDREALGTSGANDLILKLAIEDACQHGCHHYHLGESGGSSSLAHFKERFGAVPYPYAEYYFEKLPFTRVDNALQSFVKRVIRFKD